MGKDALKIKKTLSICLYSYASSFSYLVCSAAFKLGRSHSSSCSPPIELHGEIL